MASGSCLLFCIPTMGNRICLCSVWRVYSAYKRHHSHPHQVPVCQEACQEEGKLRCHHQLYCHLPRHRRGHGHVRVPCCDVPKILQVVWSIPVVLMPTSFQDYVLGVWHLKQYEMFQAVEKYDVSIKQNVCFVFGTLHLGQAFG